MAKRVASTGLDILNAGSDPTKASDNEEGLESLGIEHGDIDRVEGDDNGNDLSPLLAAISEPVPLVPKGDVGSAAKPDKRTEYQRDEERSSWDEASKITTFNNLVTTQRAIFLLFQVSSKNSFSSFNYPVYLGPSLGICIYQYLPHIILGNACAINRIPSKPLYNSRSRPMMPNS